ncbi:MAG TPA: transcriptional repressor LexA [Azospirillaceae bacterium]|nr:transcriptional repressor LexA [Azospirillaceae bacterium]
MLTRKQQELLFFINDRLSQDGVSPSFDEMKEALGLKSKSGIHRLITALEERGFIRRLAHRARALEVLKLPETSAGARGGDQGRGSNIIRPDFSGGSGGAPSARDPRGQAPETVSLPLYGRIAAGLPIEAIRTDSSIDVPASLLGMGEHFALEVVGDSMVEAGILDGDTVIIQRGEQADNGSIVVALVDGEEVTLKRWRRKGNAIALEAANPNYETRIFGSDRVRVQGRLVGLMRKY